MSRADELRDFLQGKTPLDLTPTPVTVELPRYLADRLAGETDGGTEIAMRTLRGRYHDRALSELMELDPDAPFNWTWGEALLPVEMTGEFVMVVSTPVREPGASVAFARQAEAEGVSMETLLERYLMEGLRRDGAFEEQG